MKLLSFILLSALFVVSSFAVMGCSGQGQTSAELRRERIRTRSADMKALHDDTETLFMIDKPSRLTDKKVR